MINPNYKSIFSIIFFNSFKTLSIQEKNYISSKMSFHHFNKGDYIVKSGEICDRLYIIRKGMVRGFYKFNKKEIITWVSADNELVTSISGYFTQEITKENIQCIEETYLESVSYQDMLYAINNFPTFEKINRILMEQYYLDAENRAFIARIPKAKDRYEHFLKTAKPTLIERLPKKYLASLLNMRPETLTRLSQGV
jgi:signal-transduction protein with cAMP-binding, CBS, and nucleotidyltransferase domain